MAPNDPPDDIDDLILDEGFIAGGRREPSAQERAERTRRIARANDDLRARGEIADGSGKPMFQRATRRRRIITVAAVVAVVIVIAAIVIVV